MKTLNTRILIVDDDRDIWKAYQMVLTPEEESTGVHLKQLDQLLEKGGEKIPENGHDFALSFAAQGQDAYKMALGALEENKPFSLAFVDVRMPPGWDGMETAAKLHQIDPDLEIVIVTAYSDRSCDEIVKSVGSPHKILFLRKPFDTEELKRLTVSLTDKWHLARDEEDRRQELQTLLCTSPSAIYSIDDQLRMLSWNQSAVMMTGYTTADVIGQKCIFHKIADDDVCKNCSQSCEYDDISLERQVVVTDKAGKRKVLSMSIAHVPATKNRPAKSIGSFWDITALEEAQVQLTEMNSQLKYEIEEKDRLREEQL